MHCHKVNILDLNASWTDFDEKRTNPSAYSYTHLQLMVRHAQQLNVKWNAQQNDDIGYST